MAAEVRDVASQVPTAIFRFFGASLLGIVPIDAAPSSVASTWAVGDAAGYVIPAGTQVTIAATGSEIYGFEVLADVTIPVGSVTTAPGEVELQALIAGEQANGLTADPELVQPVSVDGSPVPVTAITLVGTTSGGTDAELDDDYLTRLVQELELLSPRPIVPDDFSTLYQTLPEVDRALALDGYNPADNTYDNERMITLIGVDASGESVAPAVKVAGAALFAPGGPYEREVNFVVNFDDPTYTTLDVTVDVTTIAESAPAQVIADVTATIESYLSPANWGKEYEVEALGGLEVSAQWDVELDHVYYLELATLINNVAGVDRITALAFGVTGGALAQADVVLPGPAPLTRPGTITVTTS